MVAELNAKTFKSKVLHADKPVLVEVFAPWCGPCKVMAPVLEDVAKEFSGQARVYKINIDNHKDVVQPYKILGVPTLLYFSHGRLVDRKTGGASAQIITDKLTPLLNLSEADAANQEISGLFRWPFRNWLSRFFRVQYKI